MSRTSEKQSQPAPTAVTPERLMALANAFCGSATLFAAVDAGIFSCLAESGPLDAVELALHCGLNERGGRLLFDGCAALGLLLNDGMRYRNAPDVAAFLVSGTPGDLSGAIRYNRDIYAAWGRLPELARTGRPVEEPALHLGEDAARTRTFVLSMHARARVFGRAVVGRMDLTGCRRLLDVGGGSGAYSALLARRWPELEVCTVLDLPGVAAIADELLREEGLGGRVRTLPGDYRVTEFPPEQDAALFLGVLHQETPASIESLLHRAFDALRPGGRLYVMDMMTDETRAAPPFSALFALSMALTTHDGWVFSDTDLRQWLRGAGFSDVAIAPLDPPMPHWLASARKPNEPFKP